MCVNMARSERSENIEPTLQKKKKNVCLLPQILQVMLITGTKRKHVDD